MIFALVGVLMYLAIRFDGKPDLENEYTIMSIALGANFGILLLLNLKSWLLGFLSNATNRYIDT